ncbi:MAG: glycosyltransferase family 9 protein [Planctomycetes bacterium]|nr:glycosyltransferase family 9 protein [Planctomycetota bacterium]
MQPTLPAAPHFCIVRLSAIGDTIHSLPLAAALKRRHPDGSLGWVVETPAAPLVVGSPVVDWVEVVPKGWLKRPSLVWSLRRRLRSRRIDVAFDPQGLSKSAVAAWLSGARHRVGFTRGEGRELAPCLATIRVEPTGRHAVDRTLCLLAGIGAAPPATPEFPFPACPAADRQELDAFLAAPEFAPGFVLMGPWGSFPAKLWPLERFRQVAESLRDTDGLVSVVLGHGEAERRLVAAEAALSGGSLRLAPAVSPAGVVEMARRARLFVGCDSFPMHAAAGVGCPSIGLFGVTDPERLGPYGPRGTALHQGLTLVGSTRERRALGPEAMLALTVETVTAACRDALAAR